MTSLCSGEKYVVCYHTQLQNNSKSGRHILRGHESENEAGGDSPNSVPNGDDS